MSIIILNIIVFIFVELYFLTRQLSFKIDCLEIIIVMKFKIFFEHILYEINFLTFVFSTRNEHAKGECSKRRHTSGSRPLSTISDTADPSQILGVDRFDEAIVTVLHFYCCILLINLGYFLQI